VDREPDEQDLPSQNIKTPETVNTQHRINKDPKNKKDIEFAEFAQALGSQGKF